MSKIRYCLFLTGLLALMFLLTSCDAPPLISFQKSNFTWSDRQEDAFYSHFQAHYYQTDRYYFVELIWEGRGQLSHSDIVGVLCIGTDSPETDSAVLLHQGLLIRTSQLGKPHQRLVRLRVLDGQHFRATLRNGKVGKISYDGKVSGKSNFDDGKDSNWLRFEVTPKPNRQSVTQTLQTVYPLLKNEPFASQMVRLIEESEEVTGKACQEGS